MSALENILIQVGTSDSKDLHPRASTHVKSMLVGDYDATASASAAVEVKSTTQGLRIPVMTALQRDAIASPVAGLLVFTTSTTSGTDSTNKICIHTGSGWQVVTSS